MKNAKQSFLLRTLDKNYSYKEKSLRLVEFPDTMKFVHIIVHLYTIHRTVKNLTKNPSPSIFVQSTK